MFCKRILKSIGSCLIFLLDGGGQGPSAFWESGSVVGNCLFKAKKSPFKKWTFLGGFSYDESAAPSSHLEYNLPDSDSCLYSVGAFYQYNKDLSLNFGYVFADKKTRRANSSTAVGTFSDVKAHILNFSIGYKF